MNYEPPYSRVTELKLESSFLASGNDELNDTNIEPLDYEPL